MQEVDPLAVIAEEAPQLSDDDAIRIARQYWGLDVSVRSLVSERDQNFSLKDADGSETVLKIANAAESPTVTDFQIQALLYIADRSREQGIPIKVPEVLPTLNGATKINIEVQGAAHVARVVTYLTGEPVGERVPSPELARNMGTYLAHLGHALAGFTHPGSEQSMLWDLQKALGLRELLGYVVNKTVASQIAAALDEFEIHVSRVLSSLRSQVIHSDMNPDNVLIDPDNPDVVTGVIDFGDMLSAPLIADVAIACSYLRVTDGDPLRLIAEFVAGYHRVEPLRLEEIEILFELIQARLCATVAILDWRRSQRGPDDPYLGKLVGGESSAGPFLGMLREIPREHARQVFRQVCASID
jgi:Ser/Thr protein kinase RdoA (MazF antagonist)